MRRSAITCPNTSLTFVAGILAPISIASDSRVNSSVTLKIHSFEPLPVRSFRKSTVRTASGRVAVKRYCQLLWIRSSLNATLAELCNSKWPRVRASLMRRCRHCIKRC